MRISDWSSDVCSSDLSAIMPIYGKREVRFMLERTGSRVCIALERTPKSEPGKMLAEIKEELGTLEHLILIDDDAPTGSLESLLAQVVVDDAERARLDRLRPRPSSEERRGGTECVSTC